MKLGFLSDIHEDIVSLESALKLFEKEKCDKIYCLGDIVGFALPFYRYIETRDADKCVDLIKQNCEQAVIGNHDLFAIKKIPQNKAGFQYDENWYQLDYSIRESKSKNKIWLYEDNEIACVLSDSSKEYLNNLNEVEFINSEGFELLISHFCYPDFSGSAIFFPNQTFHLEKHFEFMNTNRVNFSISGHGHTEGIIHVTEDEFKINKFGHSKLNDQKQWIVIPCVARTTRSNGVAILNTSDMILTTIQLNSIS